MSTADRAPMLPTGTVTFLFTDIEGSTRLWEKDRAAMQSALARHDALLRQCIEGHQGHVVRQRDLGLSHTGEDRLLNPLRVDPRWPQFLQKMGLADV